MNDPCRTERQTWNQHAQAFYRSIGTTSASARELDRLYSAKERAAKKLDRCDARKRR